MALTDETDKVLGGCADGPSRVPKSDHAAIFIRGGSKRHLFCPPKFGNDLRALEALAEKLRRLAPPLSDGLKSRIVDVSDSGNGVYLGGKCRRGTGIVTLWNKLPADDSARTKVRLGASEPRKRVATPAASVTEPARKKTKGRNIEALMLKKLFDCPESVGWSARMWADALGCSDGTVKGTRTWKNRLSLIRAGMRTEEAQRMDKSRTRPSGRRKSKR